MYGDDKFKYEAQALDFIEDFDRANPVTTNEGWEYYYDLMGKILLQTEKQHPQKKDEIKEDRDNFTQQKLGIQGRLNLYAGTAVTLTQKNKAMFKSKGLLGLIQNKSEDNRQMKVGRFFNVQTKQQSHFFNSVNVKNKKDLNSLSIIKPKYTTNQAQKFFNKLPLLTALMQQKTGSNFPGLTQEKKEQEPQQDQDPQQLKAVKIQSAETYELNSKDKIDILTDNSQKFSVD